MVRNVVPLNAATEPTLGECAVAFLARDGRLAAEVLSNVADGWVVRRRPLTGLRSFR